MQASLDNDTITFHIYRRLEGVRVPCRLVLMRGSYDVVSEKCAPPPTPQIGRPEIQEDITPVLKTAADLQIPVQVSPDRQQVHVVSGNVPQSTQNMLQFFQLDQPCAFLGCAEMRTSYAKELEELENQPGGCRDCDRGELIRKYMTVMQKRGVTV